MNIDTIKQKLYDMVGDLVGTQPLDIKNKVDTDDDIQLADFGLDSLDIVELSLDIEEQFGVEYPEEFENCGMKFMEVVNKINDLLIGKAEYTGEWRQPD